MKMKGRMASGVKDKSRETHLGVTGLCEECMPFSELHLNKLEKEAKKMRTELSKATDKQRKDWK